MQFTTGAQRAMRSLRFVRCPFAAMDKFLYGRNKILYGDALSRIFVTTVGDVPRLPTAIETSLRGRLQLTVRKGMALTWPRAETATDYISMATDEDLKVATTTAIQEMVDFLASTKALSKHEAYQLISVAGHVAITQLVDKPVYGVHVRMPKSTFK